MTSAVVLTKNEEKGIGACLKSLQWCEEIVVIDDGSIDKTVAIAKKLGAKVFHRHLKNNFARQRNFGLQKTKGEWVLFVDADERVSLGLAREIQKAIRDNKFDGFYLRRQDWLAGQPLRYGETARIKLLRLAKKRTGKWQRRVHETWEIKGKIGQLKNKLIHYPHPTITEFLESINFYSTLHAQALFKQGIKPNFFRLIANPLGKFVGNYFFRLGFLDGAAGLIVALMMSFHSFLARGKLYLLNTKDRR